MLNNRRQFALAFRTSGGVIVCMKRLLISALLYLISAKALSDCSFESQKEDYKPEAAADMAEKAFKEKNIYFISIADGFGPSRPGFEIPITSCIFKNTKWLTLWVGADSQYCLNHEVLSEKAKSYAENFNKSMLELASGSLYEMCPDLSKR